jgi:hypothetical protein
MIKPSYKAYSGTNIRPEKTQADISRELIKYGIESIQHTQIERGFSVAFQAVVEGSDKPLTIRIDMPYDRSADHEDRVGWVEHRRLYRALYWYIKSMLEAWDSGVKTFAEVFLSHLVLPGGRTVIQDLLPKYALALESGKMDDIKLLPGAEDQL